MKFEDGREEEDVDSPEAQQKILREHPRKKRRGKTSADTVNKFLLNNASVKKYLKRKEQLNIANRTILLPKHAERNLIEEVDMNLIAKCKNRKCNTKLIYTESIFNTLEMKQSDLYTMNKKKKEESKTFICYNCEVRIEPSIYCKLRPKARAPSTM